MIKCRFGLTLVGGKGCLGGEKLQVMARVDGGLIVKVQILLDDVHNMVCISEGGANVLVLEITKPPSLLPPPMFGLRAPRNQV